MITVKIKFESDFHIGSGLGKAAYIDSLVVKDSAKKPVIPGQTIKGILRDSCMRIANSFGLKCEDKRGCECPVCSIFGRESTPGKYVFSPAVLYKTTQSEYQVRQRTSINNETGTAKEHALFSSEVSSKGSEFEFTVNCREGDEKENETTLLTAGILWTREIGGGRRRGLGSCVLTIEPQPPQEELKNMLEKLKSTADKGDDSK